MTQEDSEYLIDYLVPCYKKLFFIAFNYCFIRFLALYRMLEEELVINMYPACI